MIFPNPVFKIGKPDVINDTDLRSQRSKIIFMIEHDKNTNYEEYNYSEVNSIEANWERNVISFYNSCKEIFQYSLNKEEKELDPLRDNSSQKTKT